MENNYKKDIGKYFEVVSSTVDGDKPYILITPIDDFGGLVSAYSKEEIDELIMQLQKARRRVFEYEDGKFNFPKITITNNNN